MQLIDSHCHIDDPRFDDDRDAVISRAQEAGVTHIVAPAVDAASWPALKAVAGQHACVYPAYGLHPIFLARHQTAHLSQLREWVERERPCAIGECGLDYFLDGLPAQAQQDYLIAQLKLARDFDLPVILHARRAVDEITALLRRIGGLRGVVHSFAGSRQQADKLCELGFLLGFGGPISYERAQRLRGVVKELPAEFLLLETDAPDQPDAGIRGQRNEPQRVRHLLDVMADLRGVEVDVLARQTTDNAIRLFKLPKATTA